MKKRLAVLFLAVCMMVTSISSIAFADITGAGAGTEFVVDQDVVNPVYKVVVPTAYTFALDAFEQTDGGTMVSSSDFYFINKSNVAVQLDVAMKIAAEDGVTLSIEDARADVTATDDTKQLWLGAVAASSVTTTTAAATALKTAGDVAVYSHGTDPVVYNTTSTDGVAVTFTDTTGVETAAYGTFADLDEADATVATIGTNDAVMTFALDKATGYTLEDGTKLTGAIATAGVTSLRFVGAVNTNATWAADEIVTTVKYTMAGKSDASYDLLTDTTDTDGYALVAGSNALVKNVSSSFEEPSTDPAIVVNGSVSKAAGGSFTVTNVGSSDTISSVVVTDGTSPQSLLSAAYTYDGSTGAFALVAEKPWFDLVGANCTITVTFATAGAVTTTFTK